MRVKEALVNADARLLLCELEEFGRSVVCSNESSDRHALQSMYTDEIVLSCRPLYVACWRLHRHKEKLSQCATVVQSAARCVWVRLMMRTREQAKKRAAALVIVGRMRAARLAGVTAIENEFVSATAGLRAGVGGGARGGRGKKGLGKQMSFHSSQKGGTSGGASAAAQGGTASNTSPMAAGGGGVFEAISDAMKGFDLMSRTLFGSPDGALETDTGDAASLLGLSASPMSARGDSSIVPEPQGGRGAGGLKGPAARGAGGRGAAAARSVAASVAAGGERLARATGGHGAEGGGKAPSAAAAASAARRASLASGGASGTRGRGVAPAGSHVGADGGMTGFTQGRPPSAGAQSRGGTSVRGGGGLTPGVIARTATRSGVASRSSREALAKALGEVESQEMSERMAVYELVRVMYNIRGVIDAAALSIRERAARMMLDRAEKMRRDAMRGVAVALRSYPDTPAGRAALDRLMEK